MPITGSTHYVVTYGLVAIILLVLATTVEHTEGGTVGNSTHTSVDSSQALDNASQTTYPTTRRIDLRQKINDSLNVRISQCPSYCDGEGIYHASRHCGLQFCCLSGDHLTCCRNESMKVHEDIVDDYQCFSEFMQWMQQYWRTVLGICVPLGLISVIGSVGLCAYQGSRDRRRRRRRNTNRSASITSSMSGLSNISRSSSASRSHRGSFPSRARQSFSSFRSGNRVPDIFVLQDMDPIQPPPYTADKPPDYGEIYPS